MLELDLDCGVCLACLSFVSVAPDRGDHVEISSQLRHMTPDLWGAFARRCAPGLN